MERMIEIIGLNNFILNELSLKVPTGEIFVLLGPNGAGKTTLLDCIAGFCECEGEIKLEGRSVENTAPADREVGYLFQEISLFPHLTVEENIKFGLKDKSGKQHFGRVKVLLKMLNLSEHAHRYPSRLSGGEKQKAALARALARKPGVILMDEPFNSLDLKTTKYLRTEFKHILKNQGVTAIFVTHNIKEAMELGERIGIIVNGRMHQIGKPDEVFFNPKSGEVNSFIGRPNILECDSCSYIGDGLTEAVCGNLKIVVPTGKKTGISKISISPEDIFLSVSRPPGPEINRFSGRVVKISGNSSMCNLTIDVNGNLINCHREKKFMDSIKVGSEINLIFKLKWIKWI